MKKLAGLLFFLLSLVLGTPAGAAPTYVQASSTSGTSSTAIVTLGGAPTVGHLLIGWVASANSPSGTIASAINTSSWNIITSNQATYFGYNAIIMVYRYVQAGDTATLPAMLSSSQSFIAAEAVEISGVNGTFKNDFEQYDYKADQTSSTVTSNAYNTQTNNDLALIGAFSNTTPAMTGFSGYTLPVNTSNGSNYGSWALGYQTLATSGTSISTTFTPGSTSRPTGYIALVLSGNGTGSALVQSSKLATYPTLTAGTAAQISGSKFVAYPDLRAGTAGQMSGTRIVTYFILEPVPSTVGPLFHSFPP